MSDKIKNYQDIWSRYHDKPTNGFDPSSNNGFIYSAYSAHILPNRLNEDGLRICGDICKRSSTPLKFDRSPSDPFPPLSKDEVIGAFSLGLISRDELYNSHWNFCNLDYVPRKLTLGAIYKAVKLLNSIKDEHRNYMWENELEDAYPLAFYLPPEDQYYINKVSGNSTTLLQTIFFYINLIITLTKGDKSSKMIKWLQLEDMKHPFLRFANKKKFVDNYFEEGHPFREELK